MQPQEELRTIRAGLGLTQADFAKALGLSRKAINEMEGGKSPVERRTLLAALYLREHPEIIEEPSKPIEA